MRTPNPSSRKSKRSKPGNPDLLNETLAFAYILLGALGFGSVASTTFLVIPIVFNQLSRPDAAAVTEVLWPRYFKLHLVIGLLMGSILFLKDTIWSISFTLTVAIVLSMTINLLLAEKMRNLRESKESVDNDPNYGLMHQVTVILNLVVLGLFACSLIFAGVEGIL